MLTCQKHAKTVSEFQTITAGAKCSNCIYLGLQWLCSEKIHDEVASIFSSSCNPFACILSGPSNCLSNILCCTCPEMTKRTLHPGKIFAFWFSKCFSMKTMIIEVNISRPQYSEGSNNHMLLLNTWTTRMFDSKLNPTFQKSPEIASPASAATSPSSAMVASQPSSAMCSPSTAPATARPPTATTPAVPAATFAPVLQPPFFFSSSVAGVGGAGVGPDGVGASGTGVGKSSSFGIGTSMAAPTLAFSGTFTAMNWPFFAGWGTWMHVPGEPGGTLMQKVGPASTMGFAGCFHLYGARISRDFPLRIFFWLMVLKSTWYCWPLSLYLAWGKPAR